jgi:hypothetical protein
MTTQHDTFEARIKRGRRELLQLEEATARLRPSGQRYLGIRAIPLDRIVGTDSRGNDFDRGFKERRADLRRRRKRVADAFPDGSFPPIVTVKLGDAYFVIDGHHRVAVARARRMASIDAEVTELTARWRLGADADPLELIHAEQERIFMEESGLASAQPDLRLRFTLPVGYTELLETVQLHGYHLMLAENRVLPRADIARDWYCRVYLPTLDVIHDASLDEVCPGATDSDRFLWIYHRRRERIPEYGRQALGDAAVEATRALARERRGVRRLLRR